jgi:ferredoxin-NADP reductase
MDLAKIFFAAGAVLFIIVALDLVALLYNSLHRAATIGLQRRWQAELFSEKLALSRLQLKRQESMGSWNGTRKFKIDRVVSECADVASFYLVPHDGKPLPAFRPGQFLTFELEIPGLRSRVVRCYSLSDRPRPDYYRVTIKRVPAPPNTPDGKPGLVSNFFHSSLKAGDIVDVKAPGGGFFLDTSHLTPVVLLAGGVGITPMVSMANEIMTLTPQRETWFFFCVRNSQEHIMKEHLEKLALEQSRLKLHICYSKPNPTDVKAKDYHHEGRLDVALLKEQLPSNNFDFFMCGPGAMMSDLNEGLKAWGVAEENIHMEAFGPASVKRAPAPAAAPAGPQIKVVFTRSNKEVAWSGQADSLLDLSLAEGVSMSYGCRAGNCGTCKTAVKSGKVKYRKRPGCEVEAGSCLTCIAVPEGDLSLDA